MLLRERDLAWQENYYDHRVRDADEIEPFARYVFLNPYRAGLVGLRENWTNWWRWGERRFEFESIVAESGGVPGPWLRETGPQGASDI